MKHFLMAVLACAAACLLCACEGSESSTEPEETTTTTTETTVTTTETTTTETTTTTTTADYVLAENVVLAVEQDSVRMGGCTLTITNESDRQISYLPAYRLYDAVTGNMLEVIAEDEEPDEDSKPAEKPTYLGIGETKKIKTQWEERYGELYNGTYIYEQQLGWTTPEDEDEAPLRIVVQTEFTVDMSDFIPTMTIVEGTLQPYSCTLNIKNSLDNARDYTLVYRLYDTDSENMLVRKLDADAKISRNYHMEPGGSITLYLNWEAEIGSLLEGNYAIELELLRVGTGQSDTYRVPFVIE